MLVLVTKFEELLKQYSEESASRIGEENIRKFAEFKTRFDRCDVELQDLLWSQLTFFMFENHLQRRLKALETRIEQLEEGTNRSS